MDDQRTDRLTMRVGKHDHDGPSAILLEPGRLPVLVNELQGRCRAIQALHVALIATPWIERLGYLDGSRDAHRRRAQTDHEHHGRGAKSHPSAVRTAQGA